MNIMNSSLCCFAVLAVFAFTAVLCETDSERDESFDIYRVDEVDEESFLAGEDTPVWIAYLPDGATRVNYTRLENGIVKRAIDYWKSDKFVRYNHRARRSVDENTDTINNVWKCGTQSVPPSTPDKNDKFSESEEDIKLMNKRSSQSGPKVLHPSILVAMDYVTNWPMSKMEQEKLIMERILYALAFWNGVDLQMRHHQKPKVRLRITGIIIGRNKAAAPYLRKNQSTPRGLAYDNAFHTMLEYFNELSNLHRDFSLESYDIVATMTDATPIPRSVYTTHGVASPKPQCFSTIGRAGVIFADDLAFSGIKLAVHETAHVFGAEHDGDTADCPVVRGNVMAADTKYIGRKWSECSLKRISKILTDRGWCMENAKIYHSPGYAVEAILPGQLMWASRQCQAKGWADGNVCWNYVTCDDVYCSNNSGWSPCRSIGPAIDGTTCNPGHICLGGKCVGNSTIFNL